MRHLILSASLLALLFGGGALAQNTNTSMSAAKPANSNARAPRKYAPIFRASKDQIKQAQTILKQRAFYAGDATGKLDDATREGLRKYQQAESMKVTGTLNGATVEKMNIQMTDKQKETWMKIQASANANTK
ncbi:MAG TPA: peptidoglycan-binding domain-containing protein [Pyrinomonadaceae bacterium]|jgi:peptidoglycan hydrolase-like protein with peptidoglycan-binding domain|nr:peptidoglycan-binding domain-containing protein [Pyrinomonadaceae bacterium]